MTYPFDSNLVRRPEPLSDHSMQPGLLPVSWFCLRTQPKHEHIAAAHLRQDMGVEVFLPRIRYRRPAKSGANWITEPLFHRYLFARFDLAADLRRVQHARGIQQVVHFGDHWPVVSADVICELQRIMEGREFHTIEETLRPGDAVELLGGAVHGLKAIVTRFVPAKQRVAVLLEMLGRETPLEVDRCRLVQRYKEESAAARSDFRQQPVIATSV